ncbi:hypothetical protein ASD97_10175 [Streptomyces sp. Root63]|nr:hypothetical protein ASD29_07055 [Streptomyces sp. Root1295]KRA43965.1 hypothetical protein ASD97_10175 [Streptomyces sp. Root63]
MIGVLERAALVADSGNISVHIDADAEDYHILVNPLAYQPSEMKKLLNFLGQIGLELIDEDEYEQEFDEDGNVRYYLAMCDPKAAE